MSEVIGKAFEEDIQLYQNRLDNISMKKMLNNFCVKLKFILIWGLLPIIIVLAILGLIEIIIDFLFWQGYE